MYQKAVNVLIMHNQNTRLSKNLLQCAVNLRKPQLRMVKLLYLFVLYKLLHYNSSIQYRIDLQDD